MGDDRLQEMLSEVEQASRYLGTEVNRVRKAHNRVALRVALAFPDLYEIGTSHFGLQILYHILNQDERIVAERVFAPALDMDAALGARGLPLFSLESRRPLAQFDIVGFSMLYELDYTNVLAMMARAGIPFWQKERDRRHPLIIAGGPCTVNPEPLAPFFDAIVIGDGETVISCMAEQWMAWDRRNRRELFDRWEKIEGVYLPHRFEAHYDQEGLQHLRGKKGRTSVRRAVVEDLDRAPFPIRPVVPFGRPIHDRLRLEVARGCTRGCRFCQAGMIYRPVRERSASRLMELARSALGSTGYDEISLLSLSTGDYSRINALTETLMSECAPQNIAVSLPSLRAGTLGQEMMNQIRRVRKTGFTIAVEAGSQRLRDVVNKNINENDVIETVRDAFALGWQTIKLYFMIGLPTEDQDDVAAIVELVQRLRRLRPPGGRRGQINVSVATFIPKAHTPFQWCGQLSRQTADERIQWLKKMLQRPGVQFKWQDPRVSFIEGIWARGDRRLAPLLVDAFKKGCRFDGWSDHFRYDRWLAAMAECQIDPEFFTTRVRSLDEALPWEHIESGVQKEFLKEEWKKALGAITTEDCREGSCQGCGVCDFKRVKPVVHAGQAIPDPEVTGDCAKDSLQRVRLCYRKVGNARFFGHLETANIFLRALRRCKAPLAFSGGFHPKAKISFEDALPVGIESLAEYMNIQLRHSVDLQALNEKLNRELPDGMEVIEVEGNAKPAKTDWYRYTCTLGDATDSALKLNAFSKSEHWILERTNTKGKSQRIDLKQCIFRMGLQDDGKLMLVIGKNEGPSVRPGDVLKDVMGLSVDAIKHLRIVKTKTGAVAPPE